MKFENKTKNIYKIAVIGGGAAGVNFAHDLVMRFIKNRVTNIKIHVFEPGEIGSGLAYQDDMDCLLLNVRAKAMNLKNSLIGEYKDWCKNQGYSECQYDEEFLPRKLFGFYLKDLFKETISLAAQHKIILCHMKEEVLDINKESAYQIDTQYNQYSNYKFVMLAIGHNEPSDYYNLSKASGYINNPYPIKKNIINIHKSENVAILGTSLTAIDVAVSLIENNHKATVTMYSRTGLLPSVKGKTATCTMKYITQEKLKNSRASCKIANNLSR